MMQTTRLFVGVPIQQEIKKIFHQLKIKNKNIEGIRWVSDDNLHITTCFLGDIENNKISNVVFMLQQFLLGKKELKLHFDRFQLSPKRKPYMIWARFQQDECFSDLSISMMKIFSREINKIKRPIPHITLARFNKQTNINEINLSNNLNNIEVKMRKIILYKSILKPSGAQYYPIAEYNLIPNL